MLTKTAESKARRLRARRRRDHRNSSGHRGLRGLESSLVLIAKRSRSRQGAEANVQPKAETLGNRASLVRQIEQARSFLRWGTGRGREKGHPVVPHSTGDRMTGLARQLGTGALQAVATQKIVHRLWIRATIDEERDRHLISGTRKAN